MRMSTSVDFFGAAFFFDATVFFVAVLFGAAFFFGVVAFGAAFFLDAAVGRPVNVVDVSTPIFIDGLERLAADFFLWTDLERVVCAPVAEELCLLEGCDFLTAAM